MRGVVFTLHVITKYIDLVFNLTVNCKLNALNSEDA